MCILLLLSSLSCCRLLISPRSCACTWTTPYTSPERTQNKTNTICLIFFCFFFCHNEILAMIWLIKAVSMHATSCKTKPIFFQNPNKSDNSVKWSPFCQTFCQSSAPPIPATAAFSSSSTRGVSTARATRRPCETERKTERTGQRPKQTQTQNTANRKKPKQNTFHDNTHSHLISSLSFLSYSYHSSLECLSFSLRQGHSLSVHSLSQPGHALALSVLAARLQIQQQLVQTNKVPRKLRIHIAFLVAKETFDGEQSSVDSNNTTEQKTKQIKNKRSYFLFLFVTCRSGRAGCPDCPRCPTEATADDPSCSAQHPLINKENEHSKHIFATFKRSKTKQNFKHQGRRFSPAMTRPISSITCSLRHTSSSGLISSTLLPATNSNSSLPCNFRFCLKNTKTLLSYTAPSHSLAMVAFTLAHSSVEKLITLTCGVATFSLLSTRVANTSRAGSPLPFSTACLEAQLPSRPLTKKTPPLPPLLLCTVVARSQLLAVMLLSSADKLTSKGRASMTSHLRCSSTSLRRFFSSTLPPLPKNSSWREGQSRPIQATAATGGGGGGGGGGAQETCIKQNFKKWFCSRHSHPN
jgi:hypothetical protein